MPWIFYFGWTESLVIMKRHYAMIIMQAIDVEMLWYGYVIILCLCWCSFIWVAVVLGLCGMRYSLRHFHSLCMEMLWIYKTNTVKVSYSREVYGEGSGGGCSKVGHAAGAYTGRDSLDSGAYASDDIYGRYSGIVSYETLYKGYSGGYGGGYDAGYEVSSSGNDKGLYNLCRQGYGKRLYADQGYGKRLLCIRYEKGSRGNQRKRYDRKDGQLYDTCNLI